LRAVGGSEGVRSRSAQAGRLSGRSGRKISLSGDKGRRNNASCSVSSISHHSPRRSESGQAAEAPGPIPCAASRCSALIWSNSRSLSNFPDARQIAKRIGVKVSFKVRGLTVTGASSHSQRTTAFLHLPPRAIIPEQQADGNQARCRVLMPTAASRLRNRKPARVSLRRGRVDAGAGKGQPARKEREDPARCHARQRGRQCASGKGQAVSTRESQKLTSLLAYPFCLFASGYPLRQVSEPAC
jgi:hypothetical protein